MAGFFDALKWGFKGLSALFNSGNGMTTQSFNQSGLDQLYSSVLADSQELWAREDSAYQRMVEDMKKAGLNPWAGISSGGLSAGSNIPQMDAFNSLIAGLTHNLNAKNLEWKNISRLNDMIYDALDSSQKHLNTIFNGISSLGQAL